MFNKIIPEFKPVRDHEKAMQNYKDVASNPNVYPMRVINQICRFACECKFHGDRAYCTNPYCFWGVMKGRMRGVLKNNSLNK